VGLPDRLGYPEGPAAGKNDLHGPVEAHVVTGRHEKRLHAPSCPDHRPHGPPLVNEGRHGPFFLSRFPVLSHEPAFAAPDGRKPEEKPQVRRQAESPGMGHSLAVEENHIGKDGHLLKGAEKGRTFPKGEKAWDVGEMDRFRVGRRLQHFQGRKSENDDGGMKEGAFPPVGDVAAGDGPDILRVGVIPQNEVPAKFLLNPDGPFVIHVPPMNPADPHG